jgi:hypothetical protein
MLSKKRREPGPSSRAALFTASPPPPHPVSSFMRHLSICCEKFATCRRPEALSSADLVWSSAVAVALCASLFLFLAAWMCSVMDVVRALLFMYWSRL